MRGAKKLFPDYICWSDSDLDLDEVLGGNWTGKSSSSDNWVTDNSASGPDLVADLPETESTDNSSKENEQQPVCSPPPTKKNKKDTKQLKPKWLYKCPECQKVLKTLPGFRGHMSRSHGWKSINGKSLLI